MARDIAQWSAGQGLGKYVEVFDENEIGFSALSHLREAEELGLSMGPR